MTLPLVDEQHLVLPAKGPKYKVGPRCANPHCSGWAEVAYHGYFPEREKLHAHHLVRRSAIGAHDWVSIDGYVVGNLIGLCPWCHDDVTGNVGGHRAAIRFDIETKVFLWCLITSLPSGQVKYHPVGRLDPQPPTPDAAERASDQAEESDACPTCGHARRRRRPASSGGRRRASWNVRVPADDEDGAEVLDTLVEALADYCPSGDATPSGRYYVLVPALVHATLDLEAFKRSMKGVG